MRLAVLGGSTPFTVPLIEEMAKRLPAAGTLVLQGRDRAALAAVAGYARVLLAPRGWLVRTTVDLAAALDGADVVLHQIRYGGLAGRAEDEELAAELGVPADETLGPAGLRAALRAAPELRALAVSLLRHCPDALVLNLTNPLSVTTAVLAAAGVRVWGLCELPAATARRAAELLGLEPAALDWAYTGLNHRGFLHHLRYRGDDVLAELAAALPDRHALGVLGTEVAELGALPLKYFGLFAGHAPHGAGRAQRVAQVRAAAMAQLRAHPSQRPGSLAERPTPWYAESVGPILAAVAGAEVETVLNVAAGGLVREQRAIVAGGRCRALSAPVPPPAVCYWLERFQRHERAVLAAVADPTMATLRAACGADPLLPAERVEDAVRRLSAASPARRR